MKLVYIFKLRKSASIEEKHIEKFINLNVEETEF